MHRPLQQSGVEPVQRWLHHPQLLGSDATFTQAPPHDIKLSGHLQWPPSQTSPGLHAVPHAPQFSSSWSRSVQKVSHAIFVFTARVSPEPDVPPRGFLMHSVIPAEQTHVPPLHSRPGGQTVPHAPQFTESVMGSTQTTPPKAQAPSTLRPPGS